jgi:hypothetical protein
MAGNTPKNNACRFGKAHYQLLRSVLRG